MREKNSQATGHPDGSREIHLGLGLCLVLRSTQTLLKSSVCICVIKTVKMQYILHKCMFIELLWHWSSLVEHSLNKDWGWRLLFFLITVRY